MIAVTGFGQHSDRERALSAGFDHHLVKPVDPVVLLQMIAAQAEVPDGTRRSQHRARETPQTLVSTCAQAPGRASTRPMCQFASSGSVSVPRAVIHLSIPNVGKAPTAVVLASAGHETRATRIDAAAGEGSERNRSIHASDD